MACSYTPPSRPTIVDLGLVGYVSKLEASSPHALTHDENARQHTLPYPTLPYPYLGVHPSDGSLDLGQQVAGPRAEGGLGFRRHERVAPVHHLLHEGHDLPAGAARAKKQEGMQGEDKEQPPRPPGSEHEHEIKNKKNTRDDGKAKRKTQAQDSVSDAASE